jgi:uncharacterized protein YdeI (YjbR/CyaY-like superfamily)
MAGNEDDGRLYFATPAELRVWFESNHTSAGELFLAYYKTDSGIPSVTWPQSVDEALCFGWIDGVRKSIDAQRYFIRFTPRKAKSYWSKVNLKRFEELRAQGRVVAAGIAAFEARKGVARAAYSFEQEEPPTFTPEQEALLRGNAAAWEWFRKSAPSYQRTATWWVISAKQAATRERRLQQLIDCSAAGTTVPPLTRPTGVRGSS